MTHQSSSTAKGFTIIELVVVIAIIAVLSGIVVMNLTSMMAKARDAKRLSDMAQIQKALEMYKSDHGSYPANADNDCNGYDTGYAATDDVFIPALEPTYLGKVPGDPTVMTSCGGYEYYRYAAGSFGCDASRGAFYVLGIRNLEVTSGTHPSSPGWSCGTGYWNTLEWVTGSFEN